MRQTIHYNVEINCDPRPDGCESRIVRQLQTAFPVASCHSTRSGLLVRIISSHPFADGALRDFADLVADTLAGLGIAMSVGVVRQVTRQASGRSAALHKMQEMAAAITGLDLRPAREIPVLYFYKGLRFDLDLSGRLPAMSRMGRAGAV